MIAIGILLVIALSFLIIGQIKRADIILSPIMGIMFGFLYHKEQYEDEDEYTLQCLIGIISINVIWINQLNGSEK
jgi:uncharacterized membrane protein